MGNEWPVMLLIAAPACIALMCVGGAIAVFSNAKRPDGQTRIAFVFAGVFLLLVALGIGSCYGMFFLDMGNL